MTPDQFRAIGRLLYGIYWQGEMAQRLGYTRRHIRRMAAGKTGIGDHVASVVLDLMPAHATEVLVMAERMKRA